VAVDVVMKARVGAVQSKSHRSRHSSTAGKPLVAPIAVAPNDKSEDEEVREQRFRGCLKLSV
jgi:hypothetical protein